MTTPDTDPVWTFLRALPDRARHDLNRTDRLVIAIHRAVNDHGWIPEQLAKHCGRNLTAHNPGGVIQHRLDAIDGPPALEDGGRRVHFGCCDGGWIYPDDGEPVKCTGNRSAASEHQSHATDPPVSDHFPVTTPSGGLDFASNS